MKSNRGFLFINTYKSNCYCLNCDRRTHFSYMQILIFPPPPSYSTTSSPPFSPSFPLLFPNFFYRNSLGNLSERLLKFQKNLPEKSPRKDFLPPPLPERGKEDISRKPFISGLFKEVRGGRCLKRYRKMLGNLQELRTV